MFLVNRRPKQCVSSWQVSVQDCSFPDPHPVQDSRISRTLSVNGARRVNRLRGCREYCRRLKTESLRVVPFGGQLRLPWERGKCSTLQNPLKCVIWLTEGIMSTTPSASSLFDEVATLFASAPSQNRILEFRPSQATIQRANPARTRSGRPPRSLLTNWNSISSQIRRLFSRHPLQARPCAMTAIPELRATSCLASNR